MIRLQDTLGGHVGRETAGMKTFMAAVAVLAAIAVPAYAQLNAKRHQGDEKKTEQKQPQVDEKAYKAALERIPEPKDKYDPWAVTKPADPVKKPK
jgi:Tfp pilus assembly protein PilE